MGLFSKKDPIVERATQRTKKFAELDQKFGDDAETITLSKAVWLTSRGSYYGKKGGQLFAALDFAEALDFKPDYLPAHFGQVINYLAMGMIEDARNALKAIPEVTTDSQGNVLARKSDFAEGDKIKALLSDLETTTKPNG